MSNVADYAAWSLRCRVMSRLASETAVHNCWSWTKRHLESFYYIIVIPRNHNDCLSLVVTTNDSHFKMADEASGKSPVSPTLLVRSWMYLFLDESWQTIASMHALLFILQLYGANFQFSWLHFTILIHFGLKQLYGATMYGNKVCYKNYRQFFGDPLFFNVYFRINIPAWILSTQQDASVSQTSFVDCITCTFCTWFF